MKKPEAIKVKKLIDDWVRKQWQWEQDKSVHTDVIESESSKGWWGVEVRTDSIWYQFLYENTGYYVDETEAKEFGIKKGYTGGNRQELMNHIESKMKWDKGEHYFENYGMGILWLF